MTYDYSAESYNAAGFIATVRMQGLGKPDAIVAATKALHQVEGEDALFKIPEALNLNTLPPPVL